MEHLYGQVKGEETRCVRKYNNRRRIYITNDEINSIIPLVNAKDKRQKVSIRKYQD
jgi:hypothetical protein